MTNLKFALFFIFTLSVMAACGPNTVLPDATGRVCVPDALIAGQTCQLAGCDADSSAYFCSADARGQECRLYPGRTCVAPSATCLGGGTECVVGVGGCAHHGVSSCPVGSTVASLCSAVAGTPIPEICSDAIDNDCNGVIDNGCTTICSPSGVEICDNLDNNCNGFIDEGCDLDSDDYCTAFMAMGINGSLACPLTGLGHTVGNDCDDSNATHHPGATEVCGNSVDEDCSGSDLACTSICTPTTEVCDGRDNDCDGVIDNGGVCLPTCTPTTEVCDGRDNDCDFYIDEGGVCTSSCVPRTEICGNGIDEDCNGVDLACATCVPRTEICGNGIDEDCNGVDMPCATCVPRTEICGNGIDEDCNGVDLACATCTPYTEVCNGIDDNCNGVIDEGCGATGGSLVGDQICVSFGFDMPPLYTYGATTITRADITIYGCDGLAHTISIDSYTPAACVAITSSCTNGWLAATYSQAGVSFSDINNVGSWSAPDGTSYLGYQASDARLSGTLSSVSQVRVFARRSGLSDRELTDRSWIAYDPNGQVVSSYARVRAGQRLVRLMVPVREDAALSGSHPPDRY